MTSFGFSCAKLRSLTLWLIFPFSSPLNWFLFSLDLLGKQFNTRMSLKQQSDKSNNGQFEYINVETVLRN